MKILFPHGEVTQDELAEILELALEGRRRVKEQLKKMGSFEYYHTSFSYTLQETGEERFVGVPEQGGRDLISTDPLSPGTVYSAGVTSDGTVGLYRVEISVSSGTGQAEARWWRRRRHKGIRSARVQLPAGEKDRAWQSRATLTYPTSTSR